MLWIHDTLLHHYCNQSAKKSRRAENYQLGRYSIVPWLIQNYNVLFVWNWFLSGGIQLCTASSAYSDVDLWPQRKVWIFTRDTFSQCGCFWSLSGVCQG